MSAEFSTQEIKKNLNNHSGEAVLVVLRQWDQCGWDMPAAMTPYAFKEKLYLGVATKPFLRVDKSYGLEICTPRYALSSEWLRRDEIDLQDGSIKDWKMGSWLLDQKLGPKLGRRPYRWGGSPMEDEEDDRAGKLALEIIAGDQAATEWFIRDAEYGRMLSCEREYLEKVAAGEASASWYSDHIRQTHFNLKSLISYQRMRWALGLTTAVLPEKLEKQVEEKVWEIKTGIVERIEELYEKDGELQKELTEIQKIRLPRVTLGFEPGYERQVQEDEEDFKRMQSAAVRQKQQAHHGQLEKTIREAMSWGLHLNPWVITRKSSMPGRRTHIDVPFLVRHLAEYFEIPLVKQNK